MTRPQVSSQSTASDASAASDATDHRADLELVERALSGQSDAIEALLVRLSCVVRFVFRLNRTLGYRLPGESLEDVVQQVYLAVWPRLARYAGGAASIESWVFGFCRNCLRAEVRRRHTHRLRIVPASTAGRVDSSAESGSVDVSMAVDVVEPDSNRERAEGLEALRDELDRLDQEERIVVELRHLEDWSFERIAAHIGVPVSTVKDRCYRALTKMKGRLRRRDVSA